MKTIIDDNTIFASGVKNISVNHNPENLSQCKKVRAITIGKNCWIATNGVILPVKRPILSIQDEGELSKLIKKTNSGALYDDFNEIATVLKQWYSEWKERGIVIYKSNATEVAKYSREQQTGELAKILKHSCKKDYAR